MIQDVRANNSDHYLVEAKIKSNNHHKISPEKVRKIEYQTINIYKLTNKQIVKDYENRYIQKLNLEEKQKTLKQILREATKKICGTSKKNKK